MTYQQWIHQNVHDDGYGQCKDITKAMLKQFPELRRVRGHYYCWIWGEREHWWLMDGDVVIDPIAEQFPSKGEGSYVEWDENQPEPTGMCPNCGEYCYGGYCCTDECLADFLKSLKGPL